MSARLLPLALFLFIAAVPAWAQQKEDAAKKTTLEGLFLDFSKTQLGPLSTQEAQKKYLYTIQLEKSRIMHKLLHVVYENAYDLYQEGDFEGSRELTGRILTMDPDFQDAVILNRAAVELRGTARPGMSERKLVEDRFEEGMALYRQGRLVEASQRWEESVKLSPGNLKARYWLKKVRGELADEHFRRGQKSYRQHLLREALDEWYSALVLNPKYPRLVGVISKAEAELRRQEANEKLQRALALYGQGQTQESLKLLDEVLQIEPGEAKAQKLISEIRLEIANQYVAQGRQLYHGRKYDEAIKEWNKAVEFGYDPRRANMLVARAKDQKRREAEAEAARQRAAEEARVRAEEEAKRKADEEAKRRAEEEEAKKKQLEAEPPDVKNQPAPATSEDNKRSAVAHYTTGIVAFQKGDYSKARDEWMLCKQLDPTNIDCNEGLKKVDKTYGDTP
ncbi:MAG TPA: hypothetical protein VNI01_02225 [Elusimicrobiota bacterium]|jgi:tetratricopeptide (TPR) repeat protein|nr:hypothetical protein [Elusimicrobiota bacterium]